MTASASESLKIAFGTLTVLPVRVVWPRDGRTDAAGYYPLVGVAIGLTGAVVALALARAGATRAGSLVMAAVVVGVWAAMSRLLHWDGLADVADAFFSETTEERLRIMRDSSVGAFGVFAVAFALLFEVAALSAILGRAGAGARVYLPVVVVPMFGRLSASLGAWLGHPARADGLGASIVGAPRAGGLLPALVVVAGCGAILVVTEPVSGVILMGSGLLVAALVPHALARRFGGVTGDVLGASVILTEMSVAFVAAWVW